MISQTILPMPSQMDAIYTVHSALEYSAGQMVDLDVKSGVEGAVIKWASICTDVLKENSRIAFAGGAHPTPFREVEFWNARLKNLENIYDQLRDPRVKKMVLYLEGTGSSYLSCFKNMFKNIVAGIIEARDICLYMKPMMTHFERFENNDFLDNKEYIKPLVHCVGLLWANSRYYRSSIKIVTLLQEIGNLLIEAVMKQLDPSSIFQGEADEVYKKVDCAIAMLELFKSSFEIVRSKLPTYFEVEEEVEPWTFHPRNVFQRLMDFTDRLKLVRTILETNLEFTRLEKVEIGGLKGKVLSVKCSEVFEEFNVIYNVFRNIQYDILETEDHLIDVDYKIFDNKCLDLDRRLAAIFAQAFDDCYNLESIFKLVNVIGKLIERPLIDAEVTCKYDIILDMLNKELDTVKVLFDEASKDNTPIDKGLPPVSGTLLWLYKLKERIKKPGDEFLLLEHAIVKSEDALYTIKKCDQMLSIVEQEEKRLLSSWFAKIPSQIAGHLAKMQLTRDDHLLLLNFHPELEAIMKELRYMKMLGIENVPEEAQKFFNRNDELYNAILILNRIVEWYNHLKKHTLPVEYNLIENEINGIDDMLMQLTDDLNWTTDSKLEKDFIFVLSVVQNIFLFFLFVFALFLASSIVFLYFCDWPPLINLIADTEVMTEVKEKLKQLYDRVLQAQLNVKNVIANMEVYMYQLMFERKDGKKENLIALEDHDERVQRRYDMVRASSKEIETMIDNNYKIFSNIPLLEAPVQSEVRKIFLERAIFNSRPHVRRTKNNRSSSNRKRWWKPLRPRKRRRRKKGSKRKRKPRKNVKGKRERKRKRSNPK